MKTSIGVNTEICPLLDKIGNNFMLDVTGVAGTEVLQTDVFVTRGADTKEICVCIQ
jgi:hypothetical protein